MNKTSITRALLALPLALIAGVAHACYVPPADQMVGVAEQVSRAANVALAQAIGATPMGDGVVEYRFLVLEQLAGPALKVVTVMGGAGSDSKDNSFDHHQDSAFWAHGGGRTMNGSDCVIRPAFAVGNSYLLFLGSAPTWRSFEKIEMSGGVPDQDDKWLAYVKARLGAAFRQKS
jgi:hypothetical protein